MPEMEILLEEAIKLELNAGDLYMAYSEAFKDDRSFWWQLAIEEKNHAALLKSGRIYLERGMLPNELLYQNINDIRAINDDLRSRIEACKLNPPDKKEAYDFTCRFEESAVELHYQKIMSTATDSKIAMIFKKLGNADKDHAERIRSLMEKHEMMQN